MTKKQLKEKYTEWNIAISKLSERETEIFHKLQDLCEEKGDGKRWCGIEVLVEKLVANGEVYKTMRLVSEYYEIRGKQVALQEFALATKNFDI